ncbi:hypothetical protein BH11MYX4_BH11MYX4_48460 [soil metagenome]
MSERPEASADYSLRILWSLARWIEDTKGPEELAKVAAAAGIVPSDFDGTTRWASHAQVETVLAAARELAGDEEKFRAALGYRFQESYGAFRYMIWAVSQQQMNEAAARMGKVITNVGHFDVLSSARTTFSFRYRSERPESRLMCLSRQVAWSISPTMWGNPPAQVTEHACIANGDDHCEYHLRWFDRSRTLPIVVGGALGVVAALVIARAAQLAWLPMALLPLLGAAIAYVRELRRASELNIKFAQELNEVTRNLGQSEAETRSEIVALHQRQREWIRLMEQQVTDRTTTLERVVEGLDGLQQTRVSTIRGFSHDLRNPLFVVRGNTQFLRERFKEGEEGDALRDMESATVQIEAMLSKLMEVATAETGFVKLQPRPVTVAPLAETFRRRLKALVHGRDIKVSVFCTREAPDQILIDPLVFDRVVDNILTNAAKYTDRGSILLEISGTPSAGPVVAGAANDTSHGGFLTLKLSDTGQGIPPAQVERIFRPRPANESPSRPNSYGIGLSSVVRLMAQIGGRLDVMSKPDVGTTFWAHFPATPPEVKRGTIGDDNLESIITRVVTIRKVEGA